MVYKILGPLFFLGSIAYPLGVAWWPSREPPVLHCTVDRYESLDPRTRERTQPRMRSRDGYPVIQPFTIEGLGSKRVTLRREGEGEDEGGELVAKLHPMDGKREEPGPSGGGADWFYVREPNGVSVLQVSRNGRREVSVAFHLLGGTGPMTLVGGCMEEAVR